MRRLTLLVILYSSLGQSQPPLQIPPTKRDQPKQPASNAKDQPYSNQRGSEQSPIFVKVLPSTKTQDETTNAEAKAFGQSSPDWWMVGLTGAIVFIGIVQTIVFGVQAYRLKQTIGKMDEIAEGQTRDVQASISEATRAATAMEGVAASMTTSVESVKESVRINREIADRQKLITELQSRAYLTFLFEGMIPQNSVTGVRFQPRLRLLNQGNTPADGIRFVVLADAMAFPLSENFEFPVPRALTGYSSQIGPGMHKIISAVVPALYADTEAAQISIGVTKRIVAWGRVEYKDAFGTDRFVDFGFTYMNVGELQWMSYDTAKHNDSN